MFSSTNSHSRFIPTFPARFLERNGGSDNSNPEEDLIFQSVSEQSLETNIADVKYILSIINSLLVSFIEIIH